jgi:hypothetical protein
MNKRNNNIHIHICIQKKKKTKYIKQRIKDLFDFMIRDIKAKAISKKTKCKMSEKE